MPSFAPCRSRRTASESWSSLCEQSWTLPRRKLLPHPRAMHWRLPCLRHAVMHAQRNHNP
eukprot:590383-Amphidinium_carterae.1